jgi:hypothetical protein
LNQKRIYIRRTKSNYMSNTKVKTKSFKILKNGIIKGFFKLSDGTKTLFEIDKNGEWNQWGNNSDNLCLTVPFLEQMVRSLVFCEE